MSLIKAQSSLAEIADRLRRKFGFAGAVNSDFNTDVGLVAIVDDLTRPGTTTGGRGRRFSVTHGEAGPAAAGGFGMLFGEDVVIDYVWCMGTAATTTNAIWYGYEPGANSGLVFTQTSHSRWRESPLVSSPVPITTTPGFGAGVVAGARLAWTPMGGQTPIIPLDAFIPAGGKLLISVSAAVANTHVTVLGRIF